MSRTWRIVLASFAFVALVVAATLGPELRDGANTGAGFLAKQMCSCVFVARRSFEACRPDIMAAVDPFTAEILADPPGVRAHLSFLAERTALFDDELGCTLQ